MSSPPWSATVTGLIAAAGVVMPALITAPGAPAAELDAPEAEVDPPDDDDELLQASRIDPTSGTDMPTTLARRMKSRRVSRPAANSSMTWLAISPWPRRSRESRRWSICGDTRSLPVFLLSSGHPKSREQTFSHFPPGGTKRRTGCPGVR